MSSNGNGNEASSARLVADAWENSNAKNHDGFYLTVVRGTEIRLGHIEYGSDDTAEWVDVWLGRKVGGPAFRIVQPPLLVSDPRGEVTIEDSAGRPQRFRHDPVQAVAESIVEVRTGK